MNSRLPIRHPPEAAMRTAYRGQGCEGTGRKRGLAFGGRIREVRMLPDPEATLAGPRVRSLGQSCRAHDVPETARLTLIGHPTSGIGCGFCVPEIQPERRRAPDVVTVVTGPVEPPPG
jgi:hypothetical protein